MLPAASAPSPAGTYLDWGVIHISVTNLLIILLMLLVFALALVLPFPGSGHGRPDQPPARSDGRGGRR